MINNDELDFEPTADDLAEVEDLATEILDDDVEDDLDDWGYAPKDDRYEGNGIPSWSAWA